ncbi:DUF4136 domain-containing protein [Fibrisoma montanum]|uniref:DUF4136 domain-containing protein n=1 Tax=Fibrisoma montanum TaxID=2305895 RepID=A0A418M8D7_9BACT|nr:DUF4136 domain-containing protein [Fibrisoma montanum]RIV22354.1 DUF4136 domain-containing protein [Fibrisoma montanum]
MKRMLALATALVLGLFGHIANAQISTDYDQSVDFSKYRTYTFAKPEVNVGNNPVYKNPLLMQRIEGNLVREFNERGLTQQKTNPDLLVKIHTYTENKTRNVYNGSAYGPLFRYGWGFAPYRFYWPFFGGYYGGWNQPAYRQENFTQGTLLVDMVDARTNQLLWRGTAQGVVDNPKRLERQIARGVRKIMKDYPVKES